ncbi:hypothetical protein V498_05979 [Pseudogymnoascus sp. VKM F-4517 (FW-2822)]|nr:hypothetical protein V498_05979 [Pseudogymnoascus sp. VKM F-4517 (FW-2822)]
MDYVSSYMPTTRQEYTASEEEAAYDDTASRLPEFCISGKWKGPEISGLGTKGEGCLGSRSRWRFRRNMTPNITKQIKAAPPIAPPTIAPILLGVDGGVAASDDSVDGAAEVDSLDTSFVGADIATPVSGGEVIWPEDDDEDESEDKSEGEVEDGLEEEGLLEVVGGTVVDFSAGVGVFDGIGVFVNDVGDANRWSVLGVFAQAIQLLAVPTEHPHIPMKGRDSGYTRNATPGRAGMVINTCTCEPTVTRCYDGGGTEAP